MHRGLRQGGPDRAVLPQPLRISGDPFSMAVQARRLAKEASSLENLQERGRKCNTLRRQRKHLKKEGMG